MHFFKENFTYLEIRDPPMEKEQMPTPHIPVYIDYPVCWMATKAANPFHPVSHQP